MVNHSLIHFLAETLVDMLGLTSTIWGSFYNSFTCRDTRGFVGADIDNMVNQAAIRAGKLKANAVSMEHLDWARDKVSMGPEKKSKIPDEKTNWNTALHEAGHALVAYYTPAALPIRF